MEVSNTIKQDLNNINGRITAAGRLILPTSKTKNENLPLSMFACGG